MLMIDQDQALRHQQDDAQFQPIVDLHSGEITALRAYPRWNRDNVRRPGVTGMPNKAVEAEASWMRDRALLKRSIAAVNYLAAGASAVPVTVTISPETCLHAPTASKLEEFLAGMSVGPERLRLELSCDAVKFSSRAVAPLAKRLVAQGLTFAITEVVSADFKAAHLSAIPIRGITIDESLVKQAPGCITSADSIGDICVAAQKRALRISADGVVRLEQLRLLRQMGCHDGRGPLISRSRTLDHLMFLIKKGGCW
jgi:EAL domain-containing protein (putative c-di-GMP-specific phosphodiesterase class I)